MKKNIKCKKIPKQCINCGIYGHIHKMCREPKLSYGIIAIHINNELLELKKDIINQFTDMTQLSSVDVELPFLNEDCLKKFSDIKNNIKVLLIRGRNTIGYLDFIRGRYRLENLHQISFLFRQMTSSEIKFISDNMNDFDAIWRNTWHMKNDTNLVELYEKNIQESIDNKNERRYKNMIHDYDDYKKAFTKFHMIRERKVLNLHEIIKLSCSHVYVQDWGIPKGRRICGETDIQTAKREFEEETGYTDDEYILFNNISPLEEILNGTDGIKYKYKYYVALLTTDKHPSCDNLRKSQLCEVGDISLFPFDEALQRVGSSFESRKRAIYIVFMNIFKKCFSKNDVNDINKKNIVAK